MSYLASVEVDQRQNFIQQTDRLREMVGASRIIELTVQMARELKDKEFSKVQLFWPVSGVLRFYAEELESLGKFLTGYCSKLEELSLTTSVGIVQESGNFKADLFSLESRVRKQKDAKSASRVLPSAPYFAACSVLPQLPANHWNPSEKDADRRLRSNQAKQREEYRNQNRNQTIFGSRIPYSELPDLEKLAPQDSDSYIGILKGDVDGLGKLLADLDFARLAAEPELRGFLRKDLPPGPAAAESFCKALQEVVEFSIMAAYDQLHPAAKRKPNEPWPFRHLIVAGDDMLLFSRRDHALQLALEIQKQFDIKVSSQQIIKAALRCVGELHEPTISFGVLFAKTHYPFDASFDLAEGLLKLAKKQRAVTKTNDGFTDFHWLGDSARPTISEIRRSQDFYRDDTQPLWLTTRPWSTAQLDRRIQAANSLKLLPRRKLKQLNEIVRLGKVLSELAFKQWWSRLEDKKAFNETWTMIDPEHTDKLPKIWQETNRDGENGHETCILELVQLTEVIGQ